jgi:hypothetical protein
MDAWDFTKLTDHQIENFILNAVDVIPLYRIDIFLERKKTQHFQALDGTTDKLEKNDLRGKISWTENIIDICKKRQVDVKDSTDSFNARFRIMAQKTLQPAVYAEIAELAKPFHP